MIDYVTINKHFSNAILYGQICVSDDCGSDILTVVCYVRARYYGKKYSLSETTNRKLNDLREALGKSANEIIPKKTL